MLLSLLRLRYAQRTRRMTAPFPTQCIHLDVHGKRLEDSSLKKNQTFQRKGQLIPTLGTPPTHHHLIHLREALPTLSRSFHSKVSAWHGQVQTFVGNPHHEKDSQSQQREKKEIWGVRDRWEAERILKKCHLECSPKGNRMYSIHKTRTGCFKKRSCQRTRKCSCILKASKKKVKEISQEKKSNRYWDEH